MALGVNEARSGAGPVVLEAKDAALEVSVWTGLGALESTPFDPASRETGLFTNIGNRSHKLQ